MSQTSEKVTAGRERIRERITRIHRARRRGVLGIAEIVGLSIAALMVLVVLISYFYFLIPAQSRLTTQMLERDRLQQQLRVSQDDFRRYDDTKTTVEKITGSLQNFEMVRLVARGGGRMLLYEELNQLMQKNGLRNTSGPSYTGLESLGSRSAEQAAASATNSAATKWQSVYPGIAVNVTVEGPYQNMRHFVRDIESSKQFIIINAVELERATESNSQPSEASGPKSGNALVSLRLDLATYFQRLDRSNAQTPEKSPAGN
ncbi:MAG: GspMb/PilO family protein [Acidobacteriota bacterium]|nr:GspMb/PilO family protein [Acidobacteriota bacterium]